VHTGIRSAVFAVAMMGTAAQAAPACFTKTELPAAHLRALQQQFNVAALNCQTLGSDAPTFASHYNKFVQRFGAQLASNGEVLKRHFGHLNALDHWITLIANDAGSQVINQPNFCQLAWDRLDDMIALEPAAMEVYASKTEAAGNLATPCPEKAVITASAKKKTPSAN